MPIYVNYPNKNVNTVILVNDLLQLLNHQATITVTELHAVQYLHQLLNKGGHQCISYTQLF